MDHGLAKETLRRHGWLASEADWVADAVLSAGMLRTYLAGETAFRNDDEPGGIYGIVEGGFGVQLPAGSGELVQCTIIRRGIWFGHGPVLTGKARVMTFRATEPSSVHYVPLRAIAAISAARPEFVRRLAALSEGNYARIAMKIVSDLLIPSGERRIAATLVRISLGEPSAAGVAETPFPVHASQAEIGQMANASRDSVNRALARFTEAGWVQVEFRKIRIADLHALESFAKGS
jgi:CRP-like cAMP-binding protein